MTTPSEYPKESGDHKLRILLVDDEPVVRSSLEAVLDSHGYSIDTAQNGQEALTKFTDKSYDLIITDLVMKPVNGLELLDKAQKSDPESIVILITGYATIESAVEAIRMGAYDYLVKPFQMHSLLLTIERGAEKRRLSLENRRLIADLKTKNCELEKTLKELKQTQKLLLRSERKSAVIETVIAMKHEICNPLSAIMSKIQILQERCPKNNMSSLNNDLKTIHDLACRISNTLKELDNIQDPVSTIYTNGISMLDISGSTSNSS
ncbi:response regulator [bacterium]|nr:response regulator [candidate division CSSED10-310 bacterium]